MTQELKSCPFCGGRAEILMGGPGSHFVRCRVCHASGNDGSQMRAARLWNTRAATIPDPQAFMEAARGMREAAREGLLSVQGDVEDRTRLLEQNDDDADEDELLQHWKARAARIDAALATFDATLGEQ